MTEKKAALSLPRTAGVGMDFGLATLMATDRGDMRRLEENLVAMARHRVRAGGTPRGRKHFHRLAVRVRETVEPRRNTALNRIVSVHRPAEIVVERLDFREPRLSRRLHRIISNGGRAVFRATLADLKDQLGPASASQESSRCGYIAPKSRLSQSRFRCANCGHTAHADFAGAKVTTWRRSHGLDFRFTHRRQVLAEPHRQFSERRKCHHHHDVARDTKASSRLRLARGQIQQGRMEMRLSHASQKLRILR